MSFHRNTADGMGGESEDDLDSFLKKIEAKKLGASSSSSPAPSSSARTTASVAAPPPLSVPASSPVDPELARLRAEVAMLRAAPPPPSPEDEEKRRLQEEIAQMKRERDAMAARYTSSRSVTEAPRGHTEVKTAESALYTAKLAELNAEKEKIERERKELEERSKVLATKSSSATEARIRELEKASGTLRTDVAKMPTASALETQRATAQRTLDQVQYGVDVCFCMDCTGSMGSFIHAAKTKIIEIINEVLKLEGNAYIRIAFVGYRDHCDGNARLEVVDFVDKSTLDKFHRTLSTCAASGGGDGPEDIAGAFQAASRLSWNSSTRLLVHFADAPCHGSQYHSYADDYPGGDPHGLVPEQLLVAIARKRVDYYFMKINETTTQMEGIFKAALEAAGKPMVVNPVSANAADFVPKVVKSVSDSMIRSAAFKDARKY